MDNDTYEREILKIVKAHKRKNHEPSEPLSDAQMKNMRENVYAHVETLFPHDSGSTESPVSLTRTAQKTPFEKFRDYLTRALSFEQIHPLSTALATVAVLTAGILTYQLTTSSSNLLLPVPNSITAKNFTQHINQNTASSRAIVPQQISERRQAFVAGVTRAGLDLIGDPESPASLALLNNYTIKEENERGASIKSFNATVEQYSETEKTNVWLMSGYAIEIVHLTAQKSLENLDSEVLLDALTFYRAQTDDLTQSLINDTELSTFTANHNFLLTSDSEFKDPDSIQTIIDKTTQMKVILR